MKRLTAVAASLVLATGCCNAFLTPFYHVRRATIPYSIPKTNNDAATTSIREDREGPPQSFYQLQVNCAKAALLAIKDGHKLIEIEFPPLPAAVLEMDDVSSYQVADANLKLAVDFSKSYFATSASSFPNGTKIAILFPDEAEAKIVIDSCLDGNVNPHPNIVISSLRRSEEGDTRFFKPELVFRNLFGTAGGNVRKVDNVDVYIILLASAQELPDVQELCTVVDPGKVVIFYNLKLDILRGDLGAPAFPPKAFHDEFLSNVKPVYYLRTRQYSRSTTVPPYIVNYQGCLFRSYPGQYQTFLDTGSSGGGYRRICGSDVRPALGEFKEQLTEALKVDGVISREEKGGNILKFLRTGYKTSTWWEDERDKASDAWKT